MATKDNSPGLLSKVVKFVRNPTRDWSELDQQGTVLESDSVSPSGYSRQSLKEMIERKRQNDFVRKREFDQLRKLHRNVPVVSAEQAGRPSFFQASTTSNIDERAKTLQKIDEIEAHMSKQWWKGKQDGAAVKWGNSDPPTKSSPVAVDSAPATIAPTNSGGVFSTTLTSDLTSGSDQSEDADYDSTARNMLEFDGAFGNSGKRNRLSVEQEENLADPELEEAAIRFANGDDAGAEEGLLNALEADQVDPDTAYLWAMALFDLYRATGQQDSFDRVAIDYAQRFGYSAPAWFSTPDLLAPAVPDRSLDQDTLQPGSQVPWQCPAELDMEALQSMQTGLSRTAQPWHLNWNQLTLITPDAGRALAELFAKWCTQAVKLHFHSAEVLENTLRSLTPSNDKQRDLFWWQLRLDALRILRLQDEFELAALDYCVIYEVSPPPWQDALCECVDDAVSAHPVVHSQAQTVPMALEETQSASTIELSGELLGDITHRLDTLQSGLRDSNRFVISCTRLIRVDFPAAGSILGWVSLRESEGCHVQFRDVPRLVAAFFKLIGVNEHARVLVRNT